MKDVVLLVFLVLLQGCFSSTDEEKEKFLFETVSQGVKKFNFSYIENPKKPDSLILFDTYQKIKSTNYLGAIKIGEMTSFEIYKFFMMIDKFQDAEKLLEDDKVSFENREFYKNFTKSVRYYHTDRKKSLLYAQKELENIEKKLNLENTEDKFTLYGQYFYMRTFLVGKKKVLLEIDSMQRINNSFDKIEYDSGFKDNVEELVKRYQIND